MPRPARCCGQLRRAAEQRPVAWVFAEAPGLVAATDAGLAALAGPLTRRNDAYLVGASLRGPGCRDDALLALADPYLRWLTPYPPGEGGHPAGEQGHRDQVEERDRRQRQP